MPTSVTRGSSPRAMGMIDNIALIEAIIKSIESGKPQAA